MRMLLDSTQMRPRIQAIALTPASGALQIVAAACAVLAGCDDGGYYHPLGDIVADIEIAHEPTVFVTVHVRTSKGRVLPDGVAVHAAYRGATHDVSCSERTDPATQELFAECALELGEPSVAGEVVDVAFVAGEDIAVSSLALPPLFTIDSKTGSMTQSPITVTWSPTSGDVMAWDFHSQAVSNHQCSVTGLGPAGMIPDTGMLVIDTSKAMIVSGFPCGVSMQLMRVRTQPVAPELSGGTISASQARSF
jgi:hypothetical protein